MPSNAVLNWLDGRGWLVLSGGPDETVRAAAIGRAAADGGVAYISLKPGAGEQALADMEDLGAPPGYLVDVLTEDDDTIRARLGEAGMIVLESADSVAEARSALLGAAAEGMLTAYQNGAVILAEGSSAGVFGAWALLENDRAVNGLDWLHATLVVPAVASLAQVPAAQAFLNQQPRAIAIGVDAGSALALGPDGELEPWGERRVTVTLGREFTP
jgi:hypothetical protein